MPPELGTPRLRLRPLGPGDVDDVHRLAGDPAVSATALDIPHPFERSAAEAWIAAQPRGWAEGRQAVFGVTLGAGGALCGAVGLTIEPDHGRAALGYWIGREHWGRGIATEAAAAVLAWGFAARGLRRVHADHLGRNAASGRVLEKLGFRLEGRLRGHVVHRGEVDDLVLYGLLREEHAAGAL